MSKLVKSEVGMGVYGKRGSVGVTQPPTLKSRVSSAMALPTAVPDEGKKKKGTLMNIGGRVRTISDTTLDLLSHGTQLDISTHLMDKKLVGGFSSRQLEVAVAHARLEKEKRAARVNGAATRESSAERALEEAVKKYGEEAQASSASRTISAILLQYSEKPRKNASPLPTPPPSPIHLRKRSPTPPRQSRSTKRSSSRNRRESSAELIRVASPAAKKAAGRSLKKSPSRTSQFQRTPSPQVNRPLTRSHPKVSSSFTYNVERSGSRSHPTKISSSLTSYRQFSPLKRPLSGSANRLASSSPLRRLTSRQATALRSSTSKTNARTPSGISRSSMPVKKTKQDSKNSDPRKNKTSRPPTSPSVRTSTGSTAFQRDLEMSLLPSYQKKSSLASHKTSNNEKLEGIDSYLRRTVLKPPVPRQQGRPPTPTHPMETSSYGSRPKTAHSSSQKGILRLPSGQGGRQSYPRDSANNTRASQPVHTQRSRRSVAGERANRFFHGGKITKDLRSSRREIAYVPFEPEYRTITDPTYGRYRHFYMGMMDRLPPGFPVSLRNVLFPLPPPPDAPSLRRYRNPLKIPLRKVGLERDDYITRPSPDTTPFIFRPVPPAPNAWKNKPVAPPTSLPPSSRTSSILKRREDERPRHGGRLDENGNRPTLSPQETKRSTEDSLGQREQHWSLFPSTGVDDKKPGTPVGQTDEDFWEIQEKRRAERATWANRIREVVRAEREFVEAYKPYFREEEDAYRQYDSNFEDGPRAFLMKLLAEHVAKNKPKESSSEDEEEEERRRGMLKEPLYIPFLWEARLEPFKNISDNDYRWSLQVSEEGVRHRRRFVNWRESDLHDVYDMRCILEIYGLHEVLPFLKYNRTNDYRSTSMGTVEFLRGAVYIKGFENILLTVVSDMADGKGDKKRLGRHFGRTAKERASVRQWMTYAMTNIRRKSRLGANIWQEIESHLRTHNFFATSFYSVADVLMYLSLYPFFKPLGREKREKYPFIADFIRTIQCDENVVRANKRLMIRNWEDIPVLNRPRQ